MLALLQISIKIYRHLIKVFTQSNTKGPQLGKKRDDEGCERGKIGECAIYAYLYRTLYPFVKKTLKGLHCLL